MVRISKSDVRKRLFFVLTCTVFLFFILIARLGYVQFYLGDDLYEKAEELWSRNIPFEPKRGEIIDRNGEVIATNISAPSVLVVPRQIEHPQQVAETLAPLLEMDAKKVYEYVTKRSSIVRIHPEGRKMSPEKAKQIQSLKLSGVYVAEDSIRHYPYGDDLSHVIGFSGIDNQGLMGIEKYYDELLSGKKGYVRFFSDAKGKRMPKMADDYKAPLTGYDLKLTIDMDVQTIVERELDLAEATYHPDGAIAIAMDPGSGEILAMSSRPNFYPERYKEYQPDVYNRNLPIWSQYEPGSTFKIITLAAALEEKKVDLHNEHFFDPGYAEVAGTRLRCWKKGGHGDQTFLEVVENSCNPGFVELGERLGKDKLFSYIRDFGFGSKTGIDLEGEGTGILFKLDRVGPVELATTAFGQGVSVTPLQQVTAVSAAVNGGILYQPYVAKEWVDADTKETVLRQVPIQKRRVISEETSKEVREALESVVAKGTGKGAFVDGYRVGGKTGTAQKAQNGVYLKNNHVVSFIGFAPADDPKIVVYVAIDNPKDTLQFGGVVAAPIVGRIIDDSLRALKVEKRTEQLEKERTFLDEEYIEVPDLIGQTYRDVLEDSHRLKLDIAGEGEYIVEQSPKPGAKVKVGSTIRLLMDDKVIEED